jgi:hypothetical protein
MHGYPIFAVVKKIASSRFLGFVGGSSSNNLNFQVLEVFDLLKHFTGSQGLVESLGGSNCGLWQ